MEMNITHIQAARLGMDSVNVLVHVPRIGYCITGYCVVAVLMITKFIIPF